MLTRRTALSGLAAIASANLLQFADARAAEEAHIVLTDAEWRSKLTPRTIRDPAQGRDGAALH